MAKPKTYEITDAQALFNAFPQFFKTVPDHSKIKKGLSLGLEIDGVELIPTPPGTED